MDWTVTRDDVLSTVGVRVNPRDGPTGLRYEQRSGCDIPPVEVGVIIALEPSLGDE
jgi:hypothetical protein